MKKKLELQKLISIMLGYLGIALFIHPGQLVKLVAVCIFVSLLFFWKKKMVNWMQLKWSLLKEIRRRKYFFNRLPSGSCTLYRRR